MNTTTFFYRSSFVLILFLLSFMSPVYSVTLFENFDNPSTAANNYNGVQITYPTGDWYSFGMTKPTNPTENDRINGSYSIRLRGYAGRSTLFMMFDKAGAGIVSFNYGSYSTHSGGIFTLQKSTNLGLAWENVGSPVTVPVWNGAFLTYSAAVNYDGNIRFRIAMTETTNANTQVNIDDFQITDFGIDQTLIPVITPTTGVYETTQNVTISTATADATIYYTTDGSTPTTASLVYTVGTPVVVSATKTIKAIAVSTGKETSRIETAIINIPIVVDNIAALYNYLPASGTDLQYYKISGEAVINFIYWPSNTNTTKSISIQDNTAGIMINDNFKKLTTTYNIGDKISGIIVQINNLNDSPILFPYSDFVVSSSNNIVIPTVITLADVPAKVNQLVQINDLFFDTADGSIKFGINATLIIHDASTPVTTSVVYNTPSLIAVNPDYIGSVVPAKTNIICLILKNNPNNTYYYLFSRSLNDINVPFRPATDVSTQSITGLFVSDGKVHFESISAEKVDVFSVTGQQVKSVTSVPGTNAIALTNGIYIVKIGNSVSKVIVK